MRPGLTPAIVTRVVDGDTIRVEIDGEEYRVRYIGIDTPETVDPRRPVGCFGEEASERNRQLVEGRRRPREGRLGDRHFDRLLRYVWVEDRMVNARSLRRVTPWPPLTRRTSVTPDLFACPSGAGTGSITRPLGSGLCKRNGRAVVIPRFYRHRTRSGIMP